MLKPAIIYKDEIERKFNEQCPFCGSKWTQARYINHPFDEHHVYGGYRGECTDCGVTTKAYKTREEAVDAWNMRSCEG